MQPVARLLVPMAVAILPAVAGAGTPEWTSRIGMADETQTSQAPTSGHTRPLFDRTDLFVLAGLGAAAVAAANDDRAETNAFITRNIEDSPFDGPVDVANVYGNGAIPAAAALGMWGAGRVTGNPSLTEAGADLARALGTAWAATWVLKMAVNERRPNGGRYSFPSGHAATAFAAAPVIHAHFGNAAGYTAYALATLTGLARVEEGKHYLTDVLAGAAIGIVSGRLFTRDDAPYSVGVGASGLEMTIRF